MPLFKETRIINAPKETVYDIVSDIENYKAWNPWICDAKGIVAPGEVVTVTAVMGNKRPKFKHKILAINKPDFFHWCDLGLFTIFAYGQRKRYFKTLEDGTTEYTCELPVTGIGSFFATIFFGNFMANGMKAEADALKTFCESN